MPRAKDRSSLVLDRALLVQLILPSQPRPLAEDSLGELARLADTAGAEVVGTITQRRTRPTAGFLVGEGKLVDIQLACRRCEANVIVFDNDLTAVQVNNLDLALGIKVIDRTELILQIFARRARTVESQIQVELAQLQYLISRIPVSAKQERFHGGIGMRGPGESPLQLRNEPMRRRIRELRRKLDRIQKRERHTLMGRPRPFVCLVGYTNAGKSTLLNALASADARAHILLHKGTNRRAFLLGQVDKYSWHDLGSSFGLSEINAAFLLAQLEARESILARRRDVFDRYHQLLAPLAAELGLGLPQVPPGDLPGYHLYFVLLPDRPTRDRVLASMRAAGVMASFHYVPLHSSPGGRRFAARETDCPVTDDVSGRLVRLPFYNSLTAPDIERVVAALLDALR